MKLMILLLLVSCSTLPEESMGDEFMEEDLQTLLKDVKPHKGKKRH